MPPPRIRPGFPRPWAFDSRAALLGSKELVRPTEAGLGDTYYFACGPRRLHADAEFAVQVDDGVVDEGKDFQLELGLVGIPILDHICVCIGDGAAGKRGRATH